MPECLFAVERIKSADFKFAVAVYYCAEILNFSVELYTASCLVKSHSYALDNFRSGLCGFDFADASVLEC